MSPNGPVLRGDRSWLADQDGRPLGGPRKPLAPSRRASDSWIGECHDCRHDIIELVRKSSHHLLASEPC
jgi:hypothetical protein